MPTDRFENAVESLLSSSELYFAVTPSDGSDLAYVTKGVTLAVGGDLCVVRLDDEEVTLTLPAGKHNLRCKRIKATGTTATGITAWC